jgi:hypothetical protein
MDRPREQKTEIRKEGHILLPAYYRNYNSVTVESKKLTVYLFNSSGLTCGSNDLPLIIAFGPDKATEGT